MNKQVFHPSWILRIPMFLLGLLFLGFLIGGGFPQEETLLASLVILLLGGGFILMAICFFPSVTITSQYIKIGLRSPIDWRCITEIEKHGMYMRPTEFLFISYVKKDLTSQTPIKKRTFLILTFMHNPKKLLQAIEQYFHVQEVGHIDTIQFVVKEYEAKKKRK